MCFESRKIQGKRQNPRKVTCLHVSSAWMEETRQNNSSIGAILPQILPLTWQLVVAAVVALGLSFLLPRCSPDSVLWDSITSWFSKIFCYSSLSQETRFPFSSHSPFFTESLSCIHSHKIQDVVWSCFLLWNNKTHFYISFKSFKSE